MAAARQKEMKVSITDVATTMRTRLLCCAGCDGEGISSDQAGAATGSSYFRAQTGFAGRSVARDQHFEVLDRGEHQYQGRADESDQKQRFHHLHKGLEQMEEHTQQL